MLRGESVGGGGCSLGEGVSDSGEVGGDSMAGDSTSSSGEDMSAVV